MSTNMPTRYSRFRDRIWLVLTLAVGTAGVLLGSVGGSVALFALLGCLVLAGTFFLVGLR